MCAERHWLARPVSTWVWRKTRYGRCEHAAGVLRLQTELSGRGGGEAVGGAGRTPDSCVQSRRSSDVGSTVIPQLHRRANAGGIARLTCGRASPAGHDSTGHPISSFGYPEGGSLGLTIHSVVLHNCGLAVGLKIPGGRPNDPCPATRTRSASSRQDGREPVRAEVASAGGDVHSIQIADLSAVSHLGRRRCVAT
jgi:hypothetical protein